MSELGNESRRERALIDGWDQEELAAFLDRGSASGLVELTVACLDAWRSKLSAGPDNRLRAESGDREGLMAQFDVFRVLRAVLSESDRLGQAGAGVEIDLALIMAGLLEVFEVLLP